MSLEGRWLLDPEALDVRCRRRLQGLAAAGCLLAIGNLDGSPPSGAGLVLAVLAVALALVVPAVVQAWQGWRSEARIRSPIVVRPGARRGAHPGSPGGAHAGSPVALCTDARGQVVAPQAAGNTSEGLRPVQWHRGRRRLWLRLSDVEGRPIELSGSLVACDDASAARLDGWLVWLRRGSRR